MSRLQTWLATMLGRSAARRPEPALPAIVATLEPVSAACFQMALASAARRITEAGAGHPSMPILLASSSDELRQLLPRLRGAAVIVATLDRWLWELEGANLLYLQPGWMILEEALSAIIGDVDAEPGRPPVVALDRLFSRGCRLSLETLFYEPETAAQRANDWCGLPLFEAGDFGEADADKYRKASAALLRIVQRRPLVDTARMVSFPVGRTYATSGDGPGVFVLGAGWSHPEFDHTWSDGPRAVLAICVEDCRARRLRLRLDGTLAPGPMWLRIEFGGHPVLEMWKGEEPARDEPVSLLLPAPPPADPLLSVTLEFSSTYQPSEAGFSSDTRRLGYALRSFTLEEDTGLGEILRSLIRRRRPGLTLAVPSHHRDADFGLVEVLTESGLGGTLMTMTGDRPCRPGLDVGAAPGAGVLGATLRRVQFGGSLQELFAALAHRRSRLDLIVLATGAALGGVVEALAAGEDMGMKPLPEIAVCSGDPAFLDRCFDRHRDSYGRILHRYAVAAIFPELVLFTGRRS